MSQKRFYIAVRRIAEKGKAVIGSKAAGELLYFAGIAVVLILVVQFIEPEKQANVLQLVPGDHLSGFADAIAQDETILFQKPPEMVLLRSFSEEPEWNEVHRQWEVHPGCDYRLSENRVVSLCAGTVTQIGTSPVSGGYVDVSAGEYRLRYASVRAGEGISPGRVLELGETLGTADCSMPGETLIGPHLHLEIYKGSEITDFENLPHKNQDG